MTDLGLINQDYVATFVPYDPPRGSWFALWHPGEPGGLLEPVVPEGLVDLKRVDVELVVPAPTRGTERVTVSALKLPMVDAIGPLSGLRAGADVHPSIRAWASVVRSALGAVAQGRVLPWVSPDGWDTWRVDPLDPAQLSTVRALGEALPAIAHCTPVGEGRGRISDPEYAVRACYDALADRMIRSPAAPIGRSSAVFAQLAPTRVRHLRPWVGDIEEQRCAAAGLALRVHPPESIRGDDAPGPDQWRLTYELRSAADPSLAVEAPAVWEALDRPASDAPDGVAQLGDSPDLILLAGLARLADTCDLFPAPAGRERPTHLDLPPDSLDRFLDEVAAIEETGVSVRWPRDLVAPRLERSLVVSSAAAPSSLNPAEGTLDGLLSVDWEFMLEGVALTIEELKSISEAKRSIIPLRGRWVRLDAAALALLNAPVPELTVGEILAGVLGQEIEDPLTGFPIALRVELLGLTERLGELAGEREDPEPARLSAELRPYQRRGLAWMSDLASVGLGGILADDMGLGKTVQLLALHAKRQGPTLVVCPTSVMTNWQSEAERFCPDSRVRLFHGSSRSLDDVGPGDLVITTYGVIRTDSESLARVEWDLVVADEAQNVKNPRSRAARALRTVSSTTRIALTGTPVENRLSELWSIMDWAVPGLLGTLPQFKRNVAIPIERHNDPRAARRLSRVIAPFMLRRTKADPGIAPELPPKTERDVVVPLTPEQATLYRATTSEVLAGLAESDGIERHGLVLRLLTSLKQITNHPAHYLGEDGPLAGRSGKLAALEAILAACRTSGESTIVFSQYVAMGRLIVAHLRSLGVETEILHGGLTVKARNDLVGRFQEGELEVLVLSLKAAGTGLNLTKATTVVHYDRWWNPAVEDQATDRAYRIGQTSPVVVHRLITEGTVEDRVAQLLEQKRALADRVIGGGESWISSLSDAELADLVSLDQPLPFHRERTLERDRRAS